MTSGIVEAAGTTKGVVLERFNTEARRRFPGFDLPHATVAFLETEQGRALYRAYVEAADDPAPRPALTKAERPQGNDELLARSIHARTERIAQERGIGYADAFDVGRRTDADFAAELHIYEKLRKRLRS